MAFKQLLATACCILSLTGCAQKNDPTAESSSTATETDAAPEIEAPPATANVNWLDPSSMVTVAPPVSNGFTTTPLGNNLAVLQIDTCRLVDGISFFGEDSFKISRGNVPEALNNFAIISGYGNNFILFPDGSFLGEGPIISEGGEYIKGFPEKMFFSDRKFNSLDFTQLPQFVANGYMKIQDWSIDQRKETDNGTTTTYGEFGKHTLIVVGVGGQINTYIPGTATNIHPYFPDLRRPYFYDTKYVSSNPDDVKFWIGVCTTTYRE